MVTSGARRRSAAVVYATIAMAIGSWSPTAEAFALKHASNGQPLRWPVTQVTYVVDPSLEEAVPGGREAVGTALRGWSQAAGGPALSAVEGKGKAKPGLDGQNSVLLAPDGYAPAGNALAVTVTSYEDATGTIVDSDIVINGAHSFAVLAAGAKAARGATPMSTEGASSDDDGKIAPCDLIHVLSHEVGHTLGLADETASTSALMYSFTTPGDASVRTPSSDDIDGVTAAYGATAGAAGDSPGKSSGCNVTGAKTGPEDALGAMALMAGAGAWLAARRRVRGARLAIAIAATWVVLVSCPEAARSASNPSAITSDGIAKVARVSTTNEGGIFVTTLDLTPTACRRDPCPTKARAHVWGGTLGGITQRIGVETDADTGIPQVGDVVGVSFLDGPSDQTQEAELVSNRH